MRRGKPRIREKEYLVFRGGQEDILAMNMSDLCFSLDHHTASLVINIQLCSSLFCKLRFHHPDEKANV